MKKQLNLHDFYTAKNAIILQPVLPVQSVQTLHSSSLISSSSSAASSTAPSPAFTNNPTNDNADVCAVQHSLPLGVSEVTKISNGFYKNGKLSGFLIQKFKL